jgi:hypothetical protein
MATICIAGVVPNIGKTAVAELLLSRLAGWSAARVRVADEIGDAGAALLAGQDYLLLPFEAPPGDDPEIARLMAAGARTASVLLAEPRGLEAGLGALAASPGAAANLLVEGNAFLWARQADISIMVIGAGPSGKGLARVRPSVREIFPKIDIWAWNSRADPHGEGFYEFPQALARMGFRDTVSNRADFHLVNPLQAGHQDSAAFLECVIKRLAKRGQERGTWQRGTIQNN